MISNMKASSLLWKFMFIFSCQLHSIFRILASLIRKTHLLKCDHLHSNLSSRSIRWFITELGYLRPAIFIFGPKLSQIPSWISSQHHTNQFFRTPLPFFFSKALETLTIIWNLTFLTIISFLYRFCCFKLDILLLSL